MFITVANYKGGCAKTTTAIHIAAFLQKQGSTLLIDADLNRSASAWAKEGKLPFPVVEQESGYMESRKYKYVVIDTEARPGDRDLQALAKGCDLLVIPTLPAPLDTNALAITLRKFHDIGAESKYRVLIAKVPPPPQTDAASLRETLDARKVPLFKAEIPRLKSFETAALEGLVVYQVHDPRAAKGWECYEAVGKEILNGRE